MTEQYFLPEAIQELMAELIEINKLARADHDFFCGKTFNYEICTLKLMHQAEARKQYYG